MKSIVAFLFLLSFINVPACLNYYIVGTDVHGKKVHTEGERYFPVEINSFDKTDYIERAKSDLRNYQITKNMGSYLNYATSLVYLGEYDKAINIFNYIDKIEPNKYEIASNLGTAYELKGDNFNALKWIKKALDLNKDSHHGSEWIHVKILAKKLGFIKSENFLGIDFGKKVIPTSTYSKDNLNDILFDLSYQLSERTQFVKPKDIIVGKLFFDFGNVLSLSYDLESAKKAYEISQKYGCKNPLLQKRIDYFTKLIKDNKDSGKRVDNDYEDLETNSITTKNSNPKTSDFKNIENIKEPENKLPIIPIIGIVLALIMILLVIKIKK
ncbi:hypothetical protein GSF70_16850 [Flavobacteriaceae bacterium W22]|nr:hypothetical protein [Flavobacteriaceae bacterium W22]